MLTVSVVVPCHNGGRFLDGLLDSLAAQTFRNFDVFIVDDGSTEAETRYKLAALDPSIHIIRQENLGLSAARNAGVRAADGDLVLPLDCDDRIEPAFLAEAVATLEGANDAAFVFSHMRLYGLLEGFLPRHCSEFDQLFLNQLPYCMLMRRNLFAAVGGYDEDMREGYEDWEFNIRLLARGVRGVEIKKPLFVYRVSEQGMLLGNAARKHGTLWGRIRRKHADLYRVGHLVRTWWQSRGAPGKISLPVAIALFAVAKFLPDALFNILFYRRLTAAHRRRVMHGVLGPGSSPGDSVSASGSTRLK